MPSKPNEEIVATDAAIKSINIGIIIAKIKFVKM